MKKTIKAKDIKDLAENPCMTIQKDEKLNDFLAKKGITKLTDAFRLGRLDMAKECLQGTSEEIRN
jgi:hypothetical protein